jgi:hypothetical protein
VKLADVMSRFSAMLAKSASVAQSGAHIVARTDWVLAGDA